MIAALFGFFFCLVGLAIPIGFAMGMSAVAFVLWEQAETAVAFQRMAAGVGSFTLLALPLFVLAGSIMHHGEISPKLMRLVNCLIGHVASGLAIVASISSCLFGFVTGSSVADVAAIGSIMMPEMVKKGYGKGYTATLQACTGVLGGVIPPSILLVVIGVAGGVSIGHLLLAAAIPGWFIGMCLMATGWVIARRRNYQPRGERVSARETLSAFRDAFWALLTPIIVLGGIYSGVFTPTEAAGVAVVYALLLGLVVYRTIRFRKLYEIFREAINVSCAILLIIACGNTFGWLMAAYRGPEIINNYILSISKDPLMVFFLVMFVVLILGMVMEGTAIAIIFIPVFMPLMVSLGVNPVHFGVVFALNINIGAITPPVAVCLMTACRIIGIPYPPPFRDVFPFVATMIVALLILVFFPQITLFLGKL